jgi:hypothetical protein
MAGMATSQSDCIDFSPVRERVALQINDEAAACVAVPYLPLPEWLPGAPRARSPQGFSATS